MNNIQIIKKRLKDLKVLSQNLKKSSTSQVDRDQNLNIVGLILDMTRDVQPKRNSQNGSISGEGQISRKQSGTERELHTKKATNKNNDLRQNNQPKLSKNIENAPTNQYIISTPQPSYKIQLQLQTQQNLTLTTQISSLKQQIKQLSQKNSILLDTLRQEQDKNNLQEEEELNNYLKINQYKIAENVEVFATRIRINQEDYENIQYHTLEVKLGLREIQIKSHRKKQKNNLENNQQPQKNVRNSKRILKFDLSDLKQVKYHRNRNLILKFREDDETERYLYMKFNDYELMRKWDLGIFINLTIIMNLQKEKMFEQSNILGQNKEQEKEKQKEKQMQLQKQKQREKEKELEKQRENDFGGQLMKSIQFKRQEKNRQEDTILDKHVVQRLNQIITKSRLTLQQGQILRQYYIQNQKLIRLYNKLKESYILNKIDIRIDEPRQNIGRNLSLRSQSMSKRIRNLDESMQNPLSIVRGEEINKKIWQKQKQDSDSFRQRQIDAMSKQSIQKESSQKKQIELEGIIRDLKKPVYVTKYAEGAYKPHEKKVFLSPDEKKLCWQDKDEKNKNEFKYVLIDDIISVDYGKIGPGVEKHLQKSEIGNLNQYLLIKLKNQKKKTLELSTKSSEIMQNFSNNFKKFIKSRKNQEESEKAIKF